MKSKRSGKRESLMVTGGAGYIGSHVVRDLATHGYDLVIVDNLSTGNRDSILAGQLLEADIGDSQTIRDILDRFAIRSVLHFAALIQVEESVKNPLKYYQNNSAKSLSFIQNCIESGVENFIFSSTAAIYGIPQKIPVNEEAPLNPINPYGSSKLFTEMVLRDASVAYPHFRYVSLRYFNVAGADPLARIGQKYTKPTHLITLGLRTAMGFYPEMRVFGSDYHTPDGTAVRDFIHVDDISSAHLLALDYLKAKKTSRVFNCGYNRGSSVMEVIEAIKRVTSKDFPVVKVDRRPGDPPELVADSSRIQKELGWKPTYHNLDSIISTAWNWEKKQFQTSLG